MTAGLIVYMSGTTHIQMGILEATKHTVTSLDINVGETMALWNLGIHYCVTIQTTELWIESYFQDQLDKGKCRN